jgi:cytosine/creatinine deaminase
VPPFNRLLDAAYEEAQHGLREGGLPIGSVLANAQGTIVARGHNLRVQTGDPTAHAEVVCIRNAGRRRDWPKLTLVSTLSPCIMCTGTSLLYRIPRIVIGESENFLGAEDLFEQRGVELIRLNDPRCIEMMRRFIAEHPDLWNEDIGV